MPFNFCFYLSKQYSFLELLNFFSVFYRNVHITLLFNHRTAFLFACLLAYFSLFSLSTFSKGFKNFAICLAVSQKSLQKLLHHFLRFTYERLWEDNWPKVVSLMVELCCTCLLNGSHRLLSVEHSVCFLIPELKEVSHVICLKESTWRGKNPTHKNFCLLSVTSKHILKHSSLHFYPLLKILIDSIFSLKNVIMEIFLL